MTTPAVQDRAVVSGEVVTPTAIAGRLESAAFGLAQVLKQIIHGSHGVFHTENQLLEALAAVDKYVAATVPASMLRALVTGEERAPHEDVSKRVPPGGVSIAQQRASVPAIDYDLLAQAMVRAQMQIAAENARIPATAAAPADETDSNGNSGA